jgi:hypothetical protein
MTIEGTGHDDVDGRSPVSSHGKTALTGDHGPQPRPQPDGGEIHEGAHLRDPQSAVGRQQMNGQGLRFIVGEQDHEAAVPHFLLDLVGKDVHDAAFIRQPNDAVEQQIPRTRDRIALARIAHSRTTASVSYDAFDICPFLLITK